MDNTGEGSHALADVSFVSPDTSNPSDDPMVVRARVQAQYIGTAGFGGYATSALVFFKTTFTNNDDPNDDDVVAAGNLELGGLYRRSLSPALAVGARVGLILPTGAGRDDAAPNTLATLVARPTDVMVAAPESTGLRLGVSAAYRAGRIVTRGDLGFDVSIDQPMDYDSYSIAHANLGIGLSLDSIAMTVELQNMFPIEAGVADAAFHCAGASVQAGTRRVTGYVLASTPLDDHGRGTSFAAALGMRVRF